MSTPARQPTPAMIPAEFLSGGIGLGQLLAILAAWKWLVLGAGLGTMLLAGLVSKLVLKKSYDANASVLVDYEVNSPDINREFPSMLAVSYMTTQTAFIASQPVLGPVVDALGWAGNAEKTKGYTGPAAGLREHLMWKVLYKGLSVDNPRDSRFIYIGYSAETPEEAARVANAVAETYVRAHAERMRAPAKRRADEYLKSVDEIKKRLDAAQAAVAEFRQRTGLIDLDGKSQIEEERLRELTNALLAAEADQRATSTRRRQVARLSKGGADADVEYTSSPGVVQIKQDLLAAERRFGELRKTLGPRHPDYRVAEAEVNDLRAKMAREISGFSGGVVDNARAASSESGSMVENLRQRIGEERAKLLEVREQQDEGARLLSELEAADKLYSLALENYGQIVRDAESQFSNVALVAPATPPVKHTKPIASANAILGLVAGLLCGALGALLWEFTHRRVRCPEDLHRELGEPPLAVLGKAA